MWKVLQYTPRILYNYTKYVCGWQAYVPTVKNICAALADMNIFYVKFFQWFTETVSQNEPDAELFDFFKQFKTNVSYRTADINYPAIALLQKTVAAQGHALVLDLDQPVNSGTVALVFKGRYNGLPVVLKVLRQNIRAELESIYTHYEWFTQIMKWVRPDIKIDFLKILNDTRENCFNQLDFVQEVAHLKLFALKFQKNKNIQIPTIYGANEHLILMDYLESHPMEAWTVKDYHAYAKRFTHFLMASYFIKDIYHGDLHMGNVVFMKNQRIGLIDFGIVGQLNITNQNFIFELFRSLGENDYKAVVELYMDYVLATTAGSEGVDPGLRAQIIGEAIHELEVTNNTDIFMLRHTHLLILFQTLHKHGLTLEKNMNVFLYSILSMIDTMKRLMSQETESHVINIFERLHAEHAMD